MNQDAELVSRIREGDSEAFAALYDRYKKRLFRTALAITDDQGAAEERSESQLRQSPRFSPRRATVVTKYIRSLGDDYEVYLLGAPKLYLRHGTIRFIARRYKGVDLLDPEWYIPLRERVERNAAYIILPHRLDHLPFSSDTTLEPPCALSPGLRERSVLWP